MLLFYADVNWAKDCSTKFKNGVYILLMANIFISAHAIENTLVSLAALEDSNYFFANIVSIVLLTSTDFKYAFLIESFLKEENGINCSSRIEGNTIFFTIFD